MKVNGRLREARGGTIKFLDPPYETQLITAWSLFMSAALTSREYLAAKAAVGPFVQITTGMAQIQFG